MNLSEGKREIRSIISELNDIEESVKRDFEGIGEDMCGNCLDKIANRYGEVITRLNRVNPNRLAKWAK